MKIAVTYDQGNIFQHFGHTEEFKVYEVEDGKVLSSQILASNGSGHGALAGLLGEEGVDVLICGGIGGGAHSALMDKGIKVFAGAEGSADEAVEAYLKGELTDSGVNCDHHGEDHKCGDHHDSEGCSGHHQEDEEGIGGQEFGDHQRQEGVYPAQVEEEHILGDERDLRGQHQRHQRRRREV